MIKSKRVLVIASLLTSLSLSLVSIAVSADTTTQQAYATAKIYAVGSCPAQNFSTLKAQLDCINKLLTSWGYAPVSSVPQ